MSVKFTLSDKAHCLKSLVKEIILNGVPQQAIEIFHARNRVFKLDVDHFYSINIKEFKVPHLINRAVYCTLRHSKAHRAYEYALKLREMGFGTPEPFAFIDLHNNMLLGRSYYICRHLNDYTDLRNIHDYADKRTLLDQLAHLMYRMHCAGILMKDFSQGNVLWRKEQDGKYDFQLIDINRMSFGIKSKKQLFTNFQRISEYDDDLRMLAESYARYANLSPKLTAEQAFATRDEYLRRIMRKRKLKQIFRKAK